MAFLERFSGKRFDGHEVTVRKFGAHSRYHKEPLWLRC